MAKDPYKEWSPFDRSEAWRNGDSDECRKYDDDRDSGDRAYEEWRNGNEFRDPEDGHRFS